MATLLALLALLGLLVLSFPRFLAAETISHDPVVVSNSFLPSIELVISRAVSSQQCTIVKLRHDVLNKHVHGADDVVLEVQTNTGTEEQPAELLKIFTNDVERAWSAAREECQGGLLDPASVLNAAERPSAQISFAGPSYNDLDVRPLLESGSSSNRVDFMFFADGYTENEKDKFFADAQDLVDAIAIKKEEAFGSVKSLVNWWACFLPSRESGIGTGGRPKDTALGLYRPGTELRGAYIGNLEKARALVRQLGNKCDYPIILGNSPFYGGLGGEFTTITASLLNGPLVLRHELGHSVLDVGEEYDGGGYFGVNAAPSLLELTWAHWLTNSSNVRAERNAIPLLEYPWTILNSSEPWRITFETTGTYPRNRMWFSLSGIPSVSDLIIRLDGHSLPWLPKPEIGFDRWFYDITDLGGVGGLTKGEHVLEFALTSVGKEGVAQLCNVEVFEYGSEAEFNSTIGFIGAFPTYTDSNEEFTTQPKRWNITSYRPTNEDCLMRQVTTPHFCSVCKEELWLRLLSRVDLIEDVSVSCHDAKRTIKLDLVDLRHLLTIEWKKDGAVVAELAGLSEVELGDWDSVGIWDVSVSLKTEEVRLDEHGVGNGHRRIAVTRGCEA